MIVRDSLLCFIHQSVVELWEEVLCGWKGKVFEMKCGIQKKNEGAAGEIEYLFERVCVVRYNWA